MYRTQCNTDAKAGFPVGEFVRANRSEHDWLAKSSLFL